jgi:hypothetical protein
VRSIRTGTTNELQTLIQTYLSFTLLTNYKGTKTDREQSNADDHTDIKMDITTPEVRGNKINVAKIKGHV